MPRKRGGEDGSGAQKLKRTPDCGESYFKDMWKVTENQNSPILIGLKALTEE